MITFLNYLLLFEAFALIVWGFLRPNRVYQYPFLTGWVSLLWVTPTFFSDAMPRDALMMTQIMTFLCIGASWVGFVVRPRPKWVKVEGLPGDDNRLLVAGIAISGLAAVAYARMGMMTGGGVTGLFKAEGGAYEATWEGPMVVLKLISTFIYSGIARLLITAIRRPSILRYSAVLAACVIPMATMVLLGRRGESLTFIMLILVVIYLQKGWIVPRWVFVIAAPTALVAIIVAPQYRAHSQIGGDWGKIKEIDVNKSLMEFSEEGAVEVFGGVYLIGAQAQSGKYRYGADYYNGVIGSFVPRFLVGAEFKEGLKFSPGERDESTAAVYSWQRKYYNFAYGPSVAFEQFSYLGCLVYYVIGMMMGTLWERARRGSIYGQVIYVTMLFKAVLLLLTDQSGVISFLIYLIFFVGIPLWWAAQPSKKRFPRFRHRRPTKPRMHPMAGILPGKSGVPGLLER